MLKKNIYIIANQSEIIIFLKAIVFRKRQKFIFFIQNIYKMLIDKRRGNYIINI